MMVDMSRLVGDHIVPIALGGPEFDIENVQTLCVSCNKEKTAADAKLIAERRAVEKKLVGGQKTLALENRRVSEVKECQKTDTSW